MKMKMFLIIVLFSTLNALAQVVNDTLKKTDIESNIIFNSYSFIPHPKLLNKEIWNRVSEFRFECDFLRLAVEFKEHSYVLVEIDGEKRELARSIDYRVISQNIIYLTLRKVPLFIKKYRLDPLRILSFFFLI